MHLKERRRCFLRLLLRARAPSSSPPSSRLTSIADSPPAARKVALALSRRRYESIQSTVSVQIDRVPSPCLPPADCRAPPAARPRSARVNLFLTFNAALKPTHDSRLQQLLAPRHHRCHLREANINCESLNSTCRRRPRTRPSPARPPPLSPQLPSAPPTHRLARDRKHHAAAEERHRRYGSARCPIFEGTPRRLLPRPVRPWFR